MEYEDIEVQRGNFWPNCTWKVGDRVTAGTEGFICPLTFHALFEVPSFGYKSGSCQEGLCTRSSCGPHSHLVGRYVIVYYPHFGDESPEVQGHQGACLRSCSSYTVGGLGQDLNEISMTSSCASVPCLTETDHSWTILFKQTVTFYISLLTERQVTPAISC